MYFLIIIFNIITLNSCNNLTAGKKNEFANNVVVAHRGAWRAKQFPENSIASLSHAIQLNCTGSEFDVRMTSDSILVVFHDPDYHGLLIEETTYDELSKFKLSNGENLPTLKEYLLTGLNNNTSTGLVCEIKPPGNKKRGLYIAKKVIELVNELEAQSIILSYISFDYEVLKKIHEIAPLAKTQYLNGTKSPDELKKDGISGLDYHIGVFKKHPEWIKSAKKNGMTLNAWTVNSPENIDWLLDNNFDFITTNEPELLFEKIKKRLD
ncbi:glycerophosphodiester phosphodiesterase family protein [Abyssalbus ytuae]|uniref:Glycerophosphodiester phosphodiesterase n=1 Tax=Abyssalbus ytuae TaxID=2926907 RepID=A0A9E6ZL41_9FLAO|nr:glycerophosphodiester phosphodiesterase family protein [Abyssalbus ytuae]UOB16110.1 glycerophosphodiester phosphodiesterase [Abyssalbus ytuae]